jgi:exoribonuclease R
MRGDYDIYVTVRFRAWEQNQMYPTGEIVTVIGDTSSPLAEETALKYKNGIYRKTFKTDLMPIFPEETRVVYKEDIITIDPKESTDLDDAFHVSSDGTIYVHIVDLDYYMPETHPLNAVICDRITTIYGTTVDHMLPAHWLPYVSLQGDGRKATVTIVFNRNTGMPESRHLSYIYPKRRLSYELAQELLDVPGSDMSLEIVAAKMGTRDAHKIVEQLMIRTNASIGELLSDRPEGTIIRVMPDMESPAEYIYANDMDESIFHAALNLSRYTHFTSPMRRIVDLYVLRDLKSALFGFKENVKPKLYHINDFTRRANRFYRNLDLMKFCNTHKDGVHIISAIFLESENGTGIFKLSSGLKLRLKLNIAGLIPDEPVELKLIVDNREIRLNRRLRGTLEGQAVPHTPSLPLRGIAYD